MNATGTMTPWPSLFLEIKEINKEVCRKSKEGGGRERDAVFFVVVFWGGPGGRPRGGGRISLSLPQSSALPPQRRCLHLSFRQNRQP